MTGSWTTASRLVEAMLVGLCCVACGPSPVDAGPGDDVLFLVQQGPPVAIMDALYQGRVELDQAGCLRLGADPIGHTVIWPHGSRLARDQASLVILNDSGDEVGRVGHLLRLSGGETGDLAASGALDPDLLAVALNRCSGRYWIAGDVLPPDPRP